MSRKILVLQGHPDPSSAHLGDALADAYVAAAKEAGHEVRAVRIADLVFPLLRSQASWQSAEPPEALRPAQQAIGWAEHLVLFFPLWLGGMPAYTKGFLEQVARPGFALARDAKNPLKARLLQGRSARLVVTMGMPALVYRYYFRAHSIKALERNILGFVGIAPIHRNLVGMIEGMTDVQRERWLETLRGLGERGE